MEPLSTHLATAPPVAKSADFGEQLLAIVPKAATVIAVLLAGLIGAWLLRRTTRWLVRKSGLESLGERMGAARFLYAIGAKGSIAHLLGTIVWVAALLFTVSIIAEMVELPGLAEGVAAVTGFFPRLIAAGFVLLAGTFLADLVRSVIVRAEGRQVGVRLESPQLIGQIVHHVILTVAIVLAVGQVGLETGLINILIAVAAGSVCLSLGLAFALGSRGVVQNITARHYLMGVCRAGDTVTIAGETGTVVRFTATFVVLQTDDGARSMVPCARALDTAFRVVGRDGVPPRSASTP